MQSSWTAGHAPLTCVPPGIDLPCHPHPIADGTGGSLRVSAVECSGRVQRYPGLFEVSKSLNAVVLDRWARSIDLRTARYGSDQLTHTASCCENCVVVVTRGENESLRISVKRIPYGPHIMCG